MKKKYNQIAPWLIPIALLLAWQVLSMTGWISVKVVPSPLEVIKAGMDHDRQWGIMDGYLG